VFLLAKGERNVTSLLEDLELSQSIVSHHLGLLRMNGMVVANRKGIQVMYSLADNCKCSGGKLKISLPSATVTVEGCDLGSRYWPNAAKPIVPPRKGDGREMLTNTLSLMVKAKKLKRTKLKVVRKVSTGWGEWGGASPPQFVQHHPVVGCTLVEPEAPAVRVRLFANCW